MDSKEFSSKLINSKIAVLLLVLAQGLTLKNKIKIMDLDKGKVVLFVNVTMEQEQQEETKSMYSNLNRILMKYNQPGANQFAVYAQYTHDVGGGESLFNKEIAQQLVQQGLLKHPV